MSDNLVEIKVKASVEGTPDINKVTQALDEIAPAGAGAAAGTNKVTQALGDIAPAGAAAQASTQKAAAGFDDMGTAALKINNIVQLVGNMASALGGVPAEVLKTADAYNNLQAKIKLVTGEGPAFTAAFEGIKAIAQSTSSSLEATGTLFAKIAEAGKQMGVGQAEALKLTETINQAVQLSGASAAASDAAITQLIQGLQGGVLRGDEFNSVMEQAPRLSQAMADGLGVTTGQLRKMAEDGKLTSDVLINALKDQATTVGSEFDKLPPTVGRALAPLALSVSPT